MPGLYTSAKAGLPVMLIVAVEVDPSRSTERLTRVVDVDGVDFPSQCAPPDPHVAPSCRLFITILAVPSVLCTIEHPEGNSVDVTTTCFALAKAGSILIAALTHS